MTEPDEIELALDAWEKAERAFNASPCDGDYGDVVVAYDRLGRAVGCPNFLAAAYAHALSRERTRVVELEAEYGRAARHIAEWAKDHPEEMTSETEAILFTATQTLKETQ